MAKTIKQIADEIGVTKQSVYKRFKGKLNTACAPYAHTEDGILYLDETGEQTIKMILQIPTTPIGIYWSAPMEHLLERWSAPVECDS